MPRKNKNKTLNHTTTKNKENTETKAIKLAKKGQWLLFYGGTDGERKSVADKAHFEAWKEIKKKFQLSDIQRLLRIKQLEIGNKPPTIDLAGHDGPRIEKRLLGNIEEIDISESPFSWLKKTRGRLYDLYFIPGLVVHNINCKYIETIKLLLPILEEIKVSTNKSSPTPHLGLVMSLENLDCLDQSDKEDLLDRLRGIFEVVEFDSVAAKKSRSKRITIKKLKSLITKTKKKVKEERPEGFKLETLFKEVSVQTKDKEYDKTGKGLTWQTIKTMYYKLNQNKQHIKN